MEGEVLHWEFQRPPAPIKHPSDTQVPALTSSHRSLEMDGFWGILQA